jgi:hypothetical protein
VTLGGCEAPVVSQFGAYPTTPATARLPDRREVAVYRVKHWAFDDGSAPALQLEYEPPFDVADTLAVRRFARDVWPVFVPYVMVAGTRAAILTATNLRRRRWLVAGGATVRSFGLTAERGPDGVWRLAGEAQPLPASVREFGSPGGVGIFRADGTPLPPFTVSADSSS